VLKQFKSGFPTFLETSTVSNGNFNFKNSKFNGLWKFKILSELKFDHLGNFLKKALNFLAKNAGRNI
jgi:hypothetical protein